LTWTLALDPITNDVFINKSGILQTVYGAQEVKQRIIIALQEQYGEYFLAVQNGVPFYSGTTVTGQTFAGLLGSKNFSNIEAVIRLIILNVPNVVSIASLQFTMPDHAQRAVSLAAQVEVQGANGPEIISIVTELMPPT